MRNEDHTPTLAAPSRLPPPSWVAEHLNAPNLLTGSRLVLGILLFGLIAWESWIGCLVVFTLAAITDWLDGLLARRLGISTALGRNLDPLVDKVLISGAYIFLLPVSGAGLAAWMVTVVVGREMIITSLRSYLENRGANFGADWLGKVKMVLQCVTLFAIFSALQAPACCPTASAWLNPIRDLFIYAMLIATALSGLQYLVRAALLLNRPD